jgi:excisionase family DNA binding protein
MHVATHGGMSGQTVFIDDAAVLLGVSRRTIYYRIREGRLQTIRTRGGSQRVTLASIEALRESPRSRRTDTGRPESDPRLESETLPLQV